MKKMDKKKKKNSIGFFIILFILVLLIGGGMFFGINWYQDAIFNSNTRKDQVEFTVKDGDSLLTIASELQKKGLIKDINALRIYLTLNNINPKIKIGEYLINSEVNVPQLIEIFENGVLKPSTWVTVREGVWNDEIAREISEGLNKFSESEFTTSEFLTIVEKPDNVVFSNEVETILQTYKPNGKPLNGLLFPDTYRFNTDATAKEVIETMLINFKNRLTENSISIENISLNQSNLENFYEALVLASILEREAGMNDDITLISGVFHNRLKIDYPLQSDATVNFATGKNERGASFEDLKIDSPYNTYKYPGLPPTPINNPGIRAIKGALNPAKTDYFFFWHSTKNVVYFAVTFDEHQSNIRNYP